MWPIPSLCILAFLPLPLVRAKNDPRDDDPHAEHQFERLLQCQQGRSLRTIEVRDGKWKRGEERSEPARHSDGDGAGEDAPVIRPLPHGLLSSRARAAALANARNANRVST